MPGVAEILAAQHRRCEALLVAAQDAARAGRWDRYAGVFAELQEALRSHFAFEEDELFPAFERAAAEREALAGLRAEHDEIRRALETLGAVSPRHDPEGCRSELAALAAAFGRHQAREEALLYPVPEGLARKGFA